MPCELRATIDPEIYMPPCAKGKAPETANGGADLSFRIRPDIAENKELALCHPHGTARARNLRLRRELFATVSLPSRDT